MIKRTFSMLVLGLLTVGCAESVEFKAVDATTGKPLGDVHAVVNGQRDFITLGPMRREADLGKTASNGHVESDDYDPYLFNKFTFSKAGYWDAHVDRGTGSDVRSVLVTTPYRLPYDNGVTWNDQPADGVVIVPMYPKPAEVAKATR